MFKRDFDEKPIDEKLWLIYQDVEAAKKEATEAHRGARLTLRTQLLTLFVAGAALCISIRSCNKIDEIQNNVEPQLQIQPTHMPNALDPDDATPFRSAAYTI